MSLFCSNRKKCDRPRLKGKLSPKEGRRLAVRCVVFVLLFIYVATVFSGCVSQAEVDAYIEEHGTGTGTTSTGSGTVTATTDTGGDGTGGGNGINKEFGTYNEVESAPAGLIGELVNMIGSRSQALRIVGMLTVLSIAPSLLIMLTCFVRIVMVLSFTRNAIGLQQMPPNQVIIGLALFLTFFVMSPVLDEIKTEAYIPYVAETIEFDEAIERAEKPLKRFMLRQTRTDDLGMFYSFTDEEPPADVEETSMTVLIPAYLISELRRAFEIGFFIFIPFIVVDMIVASTLMAMGMMMLPPTTISLPFKVLIFVLVDGWALTVQTLLSSFG